MPLCAICGDEKATTRDHVPPKCIFPRPRPNDLITVPACEECNNSASVFDDVFKVYLSMQAARNNDLANRLFNERTVRTLERNQALLQTIQEESFQLEVMQADGELQTVQGVLWNSEAHDAVIERTIRGLYFHHTDEVLPRDTILSVQWLREVPDEVIENMHLLNEETIGENQVTYKFHILADDPRHSVWLFDFYGAHWASGHTSPT